MRTTLNSMPIAAFWRGLLAILLVLGTSCSDEDPSLVEGAGTMPQMALMHAPTGGNARFFLLPPMVAGGQAGPNDATLLPSLRVEICQWSGTGCGATVAVLKAGAGSDRLKLTDDNYHVNWKATTAGVYRARFYALGTLLGSADIRVVEKGSELKSIDASQFIGMQRNSNLAIKFRVEPGAVTVIEPSQGGTVESPDTDVELEIPAGALSTAAAITITPLPVTDIPQNSSGAPAIAAIDLGPDGTTFNTPITLTMPFNAASLPAGVPEEDLAIYLVNADGSWTELPVVIDVEANTISAQLQHFSKYVTAPVTATGATMATPPKPKPLATGDTVDVDVTATTSVEGRTVKSAKFDITTDPTTAKVISKTDTKATLVILKPTQLEVIATMAGGYQAPGGVQTKLMLTPIQNATKIVLAKDTVVVNVLGGTTNVNVTVLDATGNEIPKFVFLTESSDPNIALPQPLPGEMKLTGMFAQGLATIRVIAAGRDGLIRDSMHVRVIRVTPSISVMPAAAGYGAPISVTAQIPTGFRKPVFFILNGVERSAVADSATGRAQVTFPGGLLPGSHAVQAELRQDHQFNAVHASGQVLIAKPALTINATVSPSPVQYTESAMLNIALVVPPGLSKVKALVVTGVPGITTLTTDSDGKASLAWKVADAPGTRSVGVSFAGDDQLLNATALAMYEVARRDVALTLGTPAPVVYGGTLRLVAAASPQVQGLTVEFILNDGNTIIGTATTSADGEAVLQTTTLLPAGVHAISARSAANALYNASASAGASASITRAPGAIATSNMTRDYAVPIALSATVSPARAGVTVTFANPDAGTISATTSVAGVASATFNTDLNPGAHTFTVAANEDCCYTGAATVSIVTINSIPTSLALAPVPQTPPNMTFNASATITPAVAGRSITFSGAGIAPVNAVTNAAGVATATLRTPGTQGTVTLLATHAAGGAYGESSATAAINVALYAASMTQFEAVTTQYKTPVTVSATHVPAVAGRKVTFAIEGGPGNSALTNSAGVATVSLHPGLLGVGTYNVVASTPADGTYESASISSTLTIARRTTSVSSTSGTIANNTSFSAIATLVPALAGKIVTWSIDGITSTATTNASGVATALIGPFTDRQGTLSGSVSWAGDNDNTPAAGTFAVSMVRAPTTVTVNDASTNYLRSVTLSATVSGERPNVPVTFTVGALELGTASTNGSGVATLTIPSVDASITPGMHVLAASTPETPYYEAGVGAGPLTIKKGFVTLTLTASPQTVEFKTATTLTAAATPAVAGLVVSFKDASGSTFATATTGDDGMAKVDVGVSAPAGFTTYSAASASNALFDGSPSSQVQITITRTITSITTDDVTTLIGSPTVLSAAISPARGDVPIRFAPQGMLPVTAMTNSAGKATASFLVPTAGARTFTATSFADCCFEGATASGTLVVNRIATTLSIPPIGLIPPNADFQITAQFSPALAGQWIQFTMNSLGTTVQTDPAGIARVTFRSPVTSGTVAVRAQFFGTATHSPAEASTDVEVGLIPITLAEIEPTTALYGSTITLRARTLPALLNRKIGFSFDGQILGSAASDANGWASIVLNLGTRTAGAHAIGINAFADGKYGALDETAAFTITQVATSLSAAGVTGRIGQPFNVVAQLTPAMAGKTISAGIAGLNFSATTDAMGIATIAVPALVNTPSGTLTGTVTYPGEAGFAGANASFILTLLGAVTTIDVHGGTATYSQLSTFTATINEPRANVPLTFFLSGVELGTASTNAQGLARLETSTPLSIDPGTHPLTVTSPAITNYDAGSGTRDITVVKAPSRISVQNVTMNESASQEFIAVLAFPTGAGHPVRFRIGDLTLTGVTGSGGSASVFAKVPGTVTSYTAEYMGTDWYLPSSAQGLITFNGTPTSIGLVLNSPTLNDGDVAYGTLPSATATLSPAIAGAKLSMSVDGASLGSVTTNQQGDAPFNIPPSMLNLGAHTITVSYVGTPGITVSSTTSQTVNVTQNMLALTPLPAVALWGDNVQLRATGAPKGHLVQFNLGFGPATVMADANGIATIGVNTSGLNVGVTTFTVGMSPTAEYGFRPVSGTLTVSPRPTTTSVASVTFPAGSGGNVEVRTDVGGVITIRDASNTVVAEATANVTGTIAIALPPFAAGVHTLTATFVPFSNRFASSQANFTVTVAKLVPTLSIEVESGKTRIPIGVRESYLVRMSPALAGKTLTLSIGGTVVGTWVTGSDGLGFFEELRWFTVGDNQPVTVTFAGDATTAPATATIHLSYFQQ